MARSVNLKGEAKGDHKLREPQQSWWVPELPNARTFLAGKRSSTEMELWILNVAAESPLLEPSGCGTHNTLAAVLWVGESRRFVVLQSQNL